MQVEHLIVSSEEVSQIEAMVGQPYSLFGAGYAKVPRWAIFVFSPLVLLLPLLCLLVVVSRFVLRSRSIYVKYAWAGFFATLLTIGAALNSVAVIAFISVPRMPPVLSTSLPDLDEKSSYPHLPFWGELESNEVSVELKPLVIVVSPVNRMGGASSSQPELGAGVLLMANKDGYLFATSKHLVSPDGRQPQQAMIATASGKRAAADVVATAKEDDLALLWITRRSGQAVFTQPIGKLNDREAVFVIGHPDGLNFSLSTGVVDGLRGNELQITAATSAGNRGGPVYDVHGNLLGVVSSQSDRDRGDNAGNPGFATAGELLESKVGWTFIGDGELRLRQYMQALGI